MAKFSRTLVELICGASRRVYPMEFIALLSEKPKGVVGEVVLLPLMVQGDGFATLDFSMLPLTSEVCGTVHSHPSPNNRPSRGDLMLFSRVRGVHAIICPPYTERDIAVYDERGRRLDLEIVEGERDKKRRRSKEGEHGKRTVNE